MSEQQLPKNVYNLNVLLLVSCLTILRDSSELNMQQTQVNEYKVEMERMSTELLNFKRKYFEQKKRETDMLSLSELAPSTTIKPFKDDVAKAKTRFVGGGFAIK